MTNVLTIALTLTPQKLLRHMTAQPVDSKMNKATVVKRLVKAEFSVDLKRVQGWRARGVMDPAPSPVVGDGARDWNLDREFFLLVRDCRISLEKIMASSSAWVSEPQLRLLTFVMLGMQNPRPQRGAR